jgi:hypothetical protein
MPFVSKAQRAKLWATNPDLARKWEAISPSPSELPERVKPKPRKKRRKR